MGEGGMNEAILTGVNALGLLIVGSLLGFADRKNFRPLWLVAAAALFAVNDAALLKLYGLVPDVIGGDWNWLGKAMALIVTLAVASHPAFGWKRSGLTLRQNKEGLPSALIVSAALVALFTWLALSSDDGSATTEAMAFQLTMPGLEEEPFFRGVFLLALNEALRGRIRALGIEWGWGAFLSSTMFGLAHAFGFDGDAFSFDLMTFLMTGVPALILVWLRERTGSLLLPILLHNFGNSIGLFV
jgi:membrane protease YdiL (CAAX protease family)